MPATAPVGTHLRVWVKPRGTTGLPQRQTSILVPGDCLVDDLKWYLKEELKPALNRFPKPSIQIYIYNPGADDYLLQHPTKVVAQNPNPEVIRVTPGLDPECPLYWDWDAAYEALARDGLK